MRTATGDKSSAQVYARPLDGEGVTVGDTDTSLTPALDVNSLAPLASPAADDFTIIQKADGTLRKLRLASLVAAKSPVGAKLQVWTTPRSATYSVPAAARMLHLGAIGPGGGGGGAGVASTAAADSCGSGGGGSASLARIHLAVELLPGTIGVAVAPSPNGGAGTTRGVGEAGGFAGVTSFSGWPLSGTASNLEAWRGGPGTSSLTTSAAGGSAGAPTSNTVFMGFGNTGQNVGPDGNAGGAGDDLGPGVAGQGTFRNGGGGGGGGGGVDSAGTGGFAGGAGGPKAGKAGTPAAGGAGVASGNGGDGQDGEDAYPPFMLSGGGGGGGGSTNTAGFTGGNGGNGGYPGGGGGGGGGVRKGTPGSSGGSGGRGAAGLAYIIAFF